MKKTSNGVLKKTLSKFKFENLFYNNRFVIVFSFFVSFITWIIVSSNGSESNPITISDIPVTVQLSDTAIQDGLRIFSGHDIKAKVAITGNRLIVGQVTKDDIQIVAQQASTTIRSPGKYMLELTAKKASVLTDYEFVSSVDPAFTTVMVDRYREAEFDVETDINFTANPEYFVGALTLSSPKVVLSGPESEISKIKKVVARGEISNELQSTAYIKTPLTLYDAYGQSISSETIALSTDEVQVTIPVLKRKKVPVLVDFINKPEGIEASGDIVKISPDSIEIAGPKETIDSLESVNLSPIDFSCVDLKNNEFDLPIDLPSGCKSLDNTYTAQVSLNLSGFREKTLWITQFSFLNVPSGRNASVYAGGINVKFVGSLSKISAIRASDVLIEIDLMQKEDASGYMEVPAKVKLDNNGVWAYGEYQTNIRLD